VRLWRRPASRQQHDAFLCLRQLDDDQFDAVGRGRRGGVQAVVALVDVGHVDVCGGGDLHGPGQAADLGVIVGIGRRDGQGQQVSQRIDRQMQLRALLALRPVIARARPAYGRGPQRAAVENGSTRLLGTACGRRSTARRSSASASKQPAAGQRCACW
jgi:hypothetical protein